MNIVLNKIKKAYQRIKAKRPTALPLGMTEFNTWAASIVELYDLPDNDSTRFALAVMVTHLNPTEDRKPKHYFAVSVKKSMANQIAFGVMQDLKAKQKAEQEAAAEAATKAEAAPKLTVVDASATESV